MVPVVPPAARASIRGHGLRFALATALACCPLTPLVVAGSGELDLRFGLRDQPTVPGRVDRMAIVALRGGLIMVFGVPLDPGRHLPLLQRRMADGLGRHLQAHGRSAQAVNSVAAGGLPE